MENLQEQNNTTSESGKQQELKDNANQTIVPVEINRTTIDAKLDGTASPLTESVAGTQQIQEDKAVNSPADVDLKLRFNHDKKRTKKNKSQRFRATIPNYYVSISNSVMTFYFSYNDFSSHRKHNSDRNYYEKGFVLFSEAISFYEEHYKYNQCTHSVQEIKDEFQRVIDKNKRPIAKDPDAMW